MTYYAPMGACCAPCARAALGAVDKNGRPIGAQPAPKPAPQPQAPATPAPAPFAWGGAPTLPAIPGFPLVSAIPAPRSAFAGILPWVLAGVGAVAVGAVILRRR